MALVAGGVPQVKKISGSATLKLIHEKYGPKAMLSQHLQFKEALK